MHSLNVDFMHNLNTQFIFQRVGHNVRLQPQSTAQIKEGEKKKTKKTPKQTKPNPCISVLASMQNTHMNHATHKLLHEPGIIMYLH